MAENRNTGHTEALLSWFLKNYKTLADGPFSHIALEPRVRRWFVGWYG